MAAADFERFRLRHFVERLVQLGECEVHDKPIDLIDVAAVLEGNPRATWFKSVGPEQAELIGNVMPCCGVPVTTPRRAAALLSAKLAADRIARMAPSTVTPAVSRAAPPWPDRPESGAADRAQHRPRPAPICASLRPRACQSCRTQPCL